MTSLHLSSGISLDRKRNCKEVTLCCRYPYVFGEAFCVLSGFAAETSTNATVLTITAFTVERYVAICHPFLSHKVSKLSRAVKFIFGIWILSLCLAVPQVRSALSSLEGRSQALALKNHPAGLPGSIPL